MGLVTREIINGRTYNIDWGQGGLPRRGPPPRIQAQAGHEASGSQSGGHAPDARVAQVALPWVAAANVVHPLDPARVVPMQPPGDARPAALPGAAPLDAGGAAPDEAPAQAAGHWLWALWVAVAQRCTDLLHRMV